MLNGMYICFKLIFVQKKTLFLQEFFFFFAFLIEAIKFIILWHLFVAPVVCLPLFVSVLSNVQ